jgi:hypothetical protein
LHGCLVGRDAVAGRSAHAWRASIDAPQALISAILVRSFALEKQRQMAVSGADAFTSPLQSEYCFSVQVSSGANPSAASRRQCRAGTRRSASSNSYFDSKAMSCAWVVFGACAWMVDEHAIPGDLVRAIPSNVVSMLGRVAVESGDWTQVAGSAASR